jgi:hypothetical protein
MRAIWLAFFYAKNSLLARDYATLFSLLGV